MSLVKGYLILAKVAPTQARFLKKRLEIASGRVRVRSSRTARLLVAAVTVVTTALGMVSSPASASATAATSQATVTTNKLIVTQSPTGTITINNGSVLQAGLVVKAEFNSAFAAGDLEIVHLDSGTTMSQVDAKIVEAGQGGAIGAAAMRWFAGTSTQSAHTTFYGGRPFAGSNKFDLIMPPGTYYVTQLRPSGNVKPSTVAKKFTVVGSPNAIQPYADQSITVVNTNGPAVFSAYSVGGGMGVIHNGAITLSNKTGSITNPTRELEFFDFTPVTSTTTPQQACDLVTTQGPGNAASFGTMSTQRSVIGYLSVPLGTYWVTSWIPSASTGTPQALECAGTLVRVVS